MIKPMISRVQWELMLTPEEIRLKARMARERGEHEARSLESKALDYETNPWPEPPENPRGEPIPYTRPIDLETPFCSHATPEDQACDACDQQVRHPPKYPDGYPKLIGYGSQR